MKYHSNAHSCLNCSSSGQLRKKRVFHCPRCEVTYFIPARQLIRDNARHHTPSINPSGDKQ